MLLFWKHVWNSHIQLVYICVYMLSHVRLSEAPWTVALQASLSMEFSRQEYWSGLPFPLPRDLSNPGIEPTSLCLLHWQVDSLPLAPLGKPQLMFSVIYTLWWKYAETLDTLNMTTFLKSRSLPSLGYTWCEYLQCITTQLVTLLK